LNLEDAPNLLPTDGILGAMFNTQQMLAGLAKLKDQISENSPGGWQVSQYLEGIVEQMQKHDLEGKIYESYSTTHPMGIRDGHADFLV
jgi:hypothetical protein